MFVTATESATAPDHIGRPVENATETKNPHGTRDKAKPDGKAGYAFALSKMPTQVIIGKWSKNPDAPRLHSCHIDFLSYLWLHGGDMKRVDEYTVEVEVDPQWGIGRDEFAAIRFKSTRTVGRWASDLKAHGLLATRKTKLRDKNPMGQGRTVWIVRLPVNAIADANAVGKSRVSDERERRKRFKAWHEGRAPKPATRSTWYRGDRAELAVDQGQVDGHTVQETPVSRGVQETPVSRAVQETPVSRGVQETPVSRGMQETSVSRAATEQQPFRQEQITRTPPRTATAHERERDAKAQAVHGGEFETRRSERQPTAALPRGGEDVEPVDRLAVEALRRFGVWNDKAQAIVAKHGGALTIACLDVHRRAKNLGAPLFVQRMDSIDPCDAFEHRDGRRTIRPTSEGHLVIDSGDGCNPVTRRQTIRDYERLVNGGALRTVAEYDLSPCD